MKSIYSHVFINLLREYDLNEPNYRFLLLIEEKGGMVYWADLRNVEFSGQPSNSLRKLVDQGYLTGPIRREDGSLEPIGIKPFCLTEKAIKVMARCKSGMHTLEWFTVSPYRVHAMRVLMENNGVLAPFDRKKFMARKNSLYSLADHKYVTHEEGVWYVTDLGRAAWQEYKVSRNG